MPMELEGGPDLPQPQVMNVKVVNRNDFPITDMFDGVPYTFKAHGEKAEPLPIDAANHIFGWYPGIPQADLKRHVQKRMGWNTPDMQKNGKDEKFFNNLEITPIIYRMVPVEIDPETGLEVGKDEHGLDSYARGSVTKERIAKHNKMLAAVDEANARNQEARPPL
jgi:hypothetical protein